MPPPLPPASAPPANGQAGRGPGGAPPARRNGGFGFVDIAGVGMALLAALIGVGVCNSRASSKYIRARERRQQWRVTAKAATTQAISQTGTQTAATAIEQKATAALAMAQTTATEATAMPTPATTQVTAAEPATAASGAAAQPTGTTQPALAARRRPIQAGISGATRC